ncbi:MAG: DUF2806 domain-containing protein [Betaproteobacteria bacterium]|nr:DUF2806 domain-containing protein [Betaproteobacteria bacterium]
MTDNLPSTSRISRAALGIVKAIGPFVLSQSAKASEAFAQHQMRLAQVEACKELMLAEVRTLTDVRRKLLEKYYETSEEERFRIKRDVGDLDKEIRRLGVYQKALEYLPKESEGQPAETAPDKPQGEISSSWQDRFDELARLQNEAWRQELLSRAMAREAQNPGSISPRALWFIGTVDDHIFHAFASLIDVCSVVLGRYMIPNHQGYYERFIPNCALGDSYRLGNVTFLLNDLGLMGDLLTSQKQIPENGMFQVACGSKYYILKTKQRLSVSGIILTPLGDSIASLYDPKENALGLEIFDAWVKSIGPEIAEVQQGT